MAQLIAQPLNTPTTFNWVLLIELLVCGVISIFFLGYFDRLFATLVSYGIRSYTWRNYHAYIDIQALQISLLGGRIFFKGIRYHAHNETILVHSGYITWNYWYRKVRDAQVFNDPPPALKTTRSGSISTNKSRSASPGKQERGGVAANKSLPCRIDVQLEGLQAFLYNRSPVYDSIIDHVSKVTDDGSGESTETIHAEPKATASGSDVTEQKDGSLKKLGQRIRSSIISSDDVQFVSGEKDTSRSVNTAQKPPIPAWLKLFPIHVGCKSAAAVLGNENTKSIITVKVDSAVGEFDAGHAGPLDPYKLLFQFEFEHPVIHMKPNLDFKELQLATAANLKNESPEESPKKLSEETRKRGPWYKLDHRRNRSSDSVRGASVNGNHQPGSSHIQAAIPGEDRWQGLSRYLDENMYNEHDEWDAVEYARTSTLADCPRIGMTFYWDIPGYVPDSVENVEGVSDAHSSNINGSAPPEYGLDLQLHGGTVNYGPWTDRQRINHQAIFFPGFYADTIPGKKLLPGQARVSTEFKLYLSIESETVLRIPVREPSKDWKWKGKAETVTAKGKDNHSRRRGKAKGKRVPFWKSRDKGKSGPNVRPFAWLDVKVMANSTVNYSMDMIAPKSGYRSNVNADVRGLEIYTSVNHGLLWRSGATSVDCDLSVPLGWNTLREWRFNITNDDLELFILRDHLFLLTDVIADWTAGPLADYFTFTPFRYLLDIHFRNFKLYLNTNDSNIINEPADPDRNHFVILHGRDLHADVTIPLENFRPIRNEVQFDVTGRDLDLQLCLAPINTVAAFVGPKQIALLEEVTLKGSHAYFSESSRNLTDRLTFNIHGVKPKVFLFGWVVDRLIKLKENYFGDDLHFRTLDEFQDLSAGRALGAETDAKAQQANRSNDLDVILCISAEDVRGLIPANIYTAEESIAIDVPYASADLRLTSYYMDLQVDFSPMTVSYSMVSEDQGSPKLSSSRTEIFIESANLCGHRLFGLPPTEPTYMCSWDVAVGRISGECSSHFLEMAFRAILCFAFTLDDDENSMPLIEPLIIPDVTFLRVRTEDVRVWLHVDTDAFLVSTGPSSVNLNDWAGSTFSDRLSVFVPDLTVACVDANSASRHRTRAREKEPVETHAYLRSTVSLNMLKRKAYFHAARQKQQDHLLEADSRTHRTPFLLLPSDDSSIRQPTQSGEDDPPALAFPPIPDPISIDADTLSNNSDSIMVSRSSTDRAVGSNIYSSSPSSSHSKPRLSRHSSRTSLASSIRTSSKFRRPRSNGVAKHTAGNAGSTTTAKRISLRNELTGEREREERGLAPSSVAFSSPLSVPYFPLNLIDPDPSELPPLSQRQDIQQISTLTELNAASGRDLDDNLIHTSLVISANPGIQVFFTPRAVAAVTSLVNLLQPRTPENILDAFQIDVVGELLGLEERKSGAGNSLELAVRVPSISARFLNVFTKADNSSSQTEVDQYDLELDHLALSTRHTVYAVAEAKNDISLLHCTLRSLAVSIKEKTLEDEDQVVAVKARIDDVLLWMASTNRLSVNLSFRDTDVATASMKVEYLASLVHRTTLLANNFAINFASLQADRKERLACLAYHLTTYGSEVDDPPFLVRTSHVLRIAPHHIRNHDSWKIISRFRYIYRSMPASAKDNLEDTTLTPANAKTLVMKTWDQWRSWDIAHVKKSLAMRRLYGSTGDLDDPSPAKVRLPLELRVRSAAVSLVIDPGSKQSEVSLHALTLNLSLSPPSGPSGLMLVQVEGEHPVENLVFQISSGSFVVQLRWEILALVENLIKIFKEGEPLEKVESEPSILLSTATSDTFKKWRTMQGIIALGNAVIGVDTPNMSAIASSKALKVSLVGTDKTGTGDGHFVSALLHASTSHTELHSHHCKRVLARVTADHPNLYMSQDNPGSHSSNVTDWRVTGTTSNLMIESKEELLGLVEAVDSVVRNEVADVKCRFGHLAQSPKPQKIITRKSSDIRLPKLAVALLMNAYTLDVALLQSLNYTLSGKVGRISVVPNLHQLLSLHIDLDLNSHSHDLISHSNSGRQSITQVILPPINAHVTLRQTEERVFLTVSTIIETITLEASAVHGLFSTLNRPEISSTFRAIEADIATLQNHIQEIFPGSPQPSPDPGAPSAPTLAYNVAVTLAGIKVKADAPVKLADAGVASLSFGLNCIQLQAFNATEDSDELIPMPEIHSQLRQLFVELMITDKRGERRCGNLALSASVHVTMRASRRAQARRAYRAQVDGIIVNVFAETASAVVDVLNHLQDRLKDVDLSREKRYLKRLRQPSRKSSMHLGESIYSDTSVASTAFFQSSFALTLLNIQICWIVGNSVPAYTGYENEDLVLSIKMIDLATKSESSSALSIEEVLLQMVPRSQDKRQRSLNSALLPQVKFNVGYVSTDEERKMSFAAVGKSLDLLLDSKFMIPANILQRSIGLAVDRFREATTSWEMTPTSTGAQRKNPFGDKRLVSLLVDADFAGANVRLQGRGRTNLKTPKLGNEHATQRGRYGQFVGDEHLAGAELHTPGIAIKVEYTDTGFESSVNAELKVNGSNNELTPTLVPLILEISDSIKTVVGDTEQKPTMIIKTESKGAQTSSLIDEGLLTADPSQLLGKTSFNLGVRICRQEFSLSCQPIARVAASAHVEDIYITANSVKSAEHDHFIAVSAYFEHLEASIQHIYSRESTFNFQIESIVLSIMNSKHLSGTAGLSAVLKVNPMRTQINARQLQDFLLFREIWIPPEIRGSSTASPAASPEPQDYLVQRYQQVASATAFPWTATLAIAEVRVELDLGQAIGKSNLIIEDVWASSRKDSNWEQNLCIGIGKVGIESTGRMSGFIELAGVKVRTMIAWPQHDGGHRQTPSIQASAGFERLRVKAAFDYQAFAIVDISAFDFVMYNVRPDSSYTKDRLVVILDGDKVNVFCTAISASQGLALFQAFERLIQENQVAYAQSLKDIEKFIRRESAVVPTRYTAKLRNDPIPEQDEHEERLQAPISLYTDVVVTLRSINVGAFPRAFFDNQIFLIEASDVQARFAATLDQGKVHCGLGTTLGQLQVALTTVAQPTGPKTLQEITVDDVVQTATTARGGTILRVPKVIATMQTWQTPASYQIDYVFKSRFEGKVDVGWNYSRISFIREMYNTHARNLASRLGKPLPESAVKITTGQNTEEDTATTQSAGDADAGKGEKITAVVNVPQSKYEYHALEPSIIETPQLRDMGEATPPLEWIGLHRDRLPNVTHQVVIVALLEVAKEVEDAYGRILGKT